MERHDDSWFPYLETSPRHLQANLLRRRVENLTSLIETTTLGRQRFYREYQAAQRVSTLLSEGLDLDPAERISHYNDYVLGLIRDVQQRARV